MPGILYVVATPIGNLEDITLRALRVLREVAVIAAEDTRRTARLLQHYSISTPTTSLHEHNERQRTAPLLERLGRGESVALVSDAGTPVVSDPGTSLIAAAHAAGIKVEPVPGPSAAVACLSASGLSAEQFLFVGFPPSRGNDRKKWFAELAAERRTVILYEAPHRIRRTLTDLLHACGDRTAAVGRELTKLHEEVVVRPISDHIAAAADDPRGEYTIAVAGPTSAEISQTTYDAALMMAEFQALVSQDAVSPRSAIRQLAEKYQLSAREVYAIVHELEK
jgi:16S rRNA (cytidine1402-2'-O)-methyltransferase